MECYKFLDISTFSGFILVLDDDTILPEELKSLWDAELVAQTHKYFRANIKMDVYFQLSSFHHKSGSDINQ